MLMDSLSNQVSCRCEYIVSCSQFFDVRNSYFYWKRQIKRQNKGGGNPNYILHAYFFVAFHLNISSCIHTRYVIALLIRSFIYYASFPKYTHTQYITVTKLDIMQNAIITI